MSIDSHRTIIDDFPCPHCAASGFPVDSRSLKNYFFAEEIRCSRCQKSVDWWSLLLQHAKLNFPPDLFTLVGAVITIIELTMKPNEIFLLDFSEAKIPPDAAVLHLVYQPYSGGVIPLEMHGNAPFRYNTPHKIRLFGAPLGANPGPTPISVLVTWVTKSYVEESWSNLVQAFESLGRKSHDATIVPANVAVESRLTRILHDYLTQFASRDRVEDFLDTKATYSYQLNILLPILSHYAGFPILPDHLRGRLNQLRDLRNQIAHKGKLDSPLDPSTCAELICSALFGFGYLELLEDHLNTTKTIKNTQNNGA